MYKQLFGPLGLVPIVLSSVLTTTASAQTSLSAAVAQIRSVPLTFSPDVLHYGTSSGQVASPKSQVQIFGFPMPGATIEIQVVGARRGVDATFYVASAPDDVLVPGVGRVLIDTSTAQSYQTTTDQGGRATLSLTLPATMQVGDELYVQCNTLNSNAPAPTWELSSAACFELGSAAKPIGMLCHLAGAITVAGVGSSVSSNALSGIYAQEWAPDTGGAVKGSVAVHTETSSITVNGTLIQDLRVQPGANANEVSWSAATFLSLPAGTADEFLVSFTSQSVEYGPYVVPGTMMARLGAVTVNLGPVPTTDNNPLGGATITLATNEVFVGPEYFDAMDALGLPDGLTQGAQVTARQVNDRFAACAEQIAAVLAAHGGDTAMFSAAMPTYLQFVAAEASGLLAFTDGRASTAAEVHELVDTNQMALEDAGVSFWLSKICALLGIDDFQDAFSDTVLEECGDLLKEMGANLNAGKYKKAAKTTAKILDKVMSKKFAEKLAGKIGKKAAGKILAKTAAKFVPIVGWAFFCGSVIWALVEQYFEE